MLFVIHALDGADAPAKRAAHYPAHKQFLQQASAFAVNIVMSGPLVQQEEPLGSFLLIESESLAAAEAFHHADPFYKAGVWAASTVHAFKKTIG